MAKADFVTSILVMLLGLGAFVTSWRMPRFENLNVDPYTVPGIVPGILGVILLGLGVVLFVRSLNRGGWRLEPQAVAAALLSGTSGRVVLVLGLTLGYAVVLVGRLPYWVATAIFVFLFIGAFEWPNSTNRRARIVTLTSAAIMAVIVAAVVSAVFQLLFLVRLP